MRTAAWALLLSVGLAAGLSLHTSSATAMQPVPERMLHPSSDAKFNADNIMAFSSFLGKSDSTSVPFVAQCFLVLAGVFVVVNLVTYIAQQVKFYRTKFQTDAETTEKQEDPADRVFSETTLANAKSALSLTPMVALLMLFLLFRAENQSIDMTKDKRWKAAEIGIAIVTSGVILQALDAFTMPFSTRFVSGIAETLGTVLAYTGFLFLITSMFIVKSSVIPLSIAAKCFVALAVLMLVCLVTIKLIRLKNRFVAATSMTVLASANDAVIEQRLEEIQSAADFAPILMLVFFYLHFRYISIGSIPQIAEIGMIGSTASLLVQALVIIGRSVWEAGAVWVRRVAVVSTNAFLFVAVEAAVDAGWPAPSSAVEATLILLFAMCLMKLVAVVLQEVTAARLDNNGGEPTESHASLSKLCQDIDGSLRYGLIAGILYLYIHFRAVFLLKEEPSAFISGVRFLPEMIVLTLVCVLVQMFIMLVEVGVGPNPVFATLVTITIAGVNVGVAGLMYAAISS